MIDDIGRSGADCTRFVRLRLRVHHELRFVEHQAGPVHCPVTFVLQPKQRVGRDHDIGFADRLR